MKPINKVKNYLKANDALNKEATRRMNAKYPGGWKDSPTNMTEWRQIRKDFYKGLGK